MDAFTTEQDASSSMQCQASFPPLPVELVRHIMETTVFMEKRAAVSLALVSRAVNDWITPLIYHTVVFKGLPAVMVELDDFIRILNAPRLNATVGATLRRLVLLNIPWSPMAVLLECPNLEYLMTDEDFLSNEDPHGCQWPSPTHAVLVSRLSFQIQGMAHIILRNVTHLYVDYPGNSLLDFVTPLSHLTHVGIGCWGGLGPGDDGTHCLHFVLGALRRPSLQKVLVHAFSEHSGEFVDELLGWPWTELAEIDDERLVVAFGLSKDMHITLMELGITIWEDAARRHGSWRREVNVRP